MHFFVLALNAHYAWVRMCVVKTGYYFACCIKIIELLFYVAM
jgi:hypothetical protein